MTYDFICKNCGKKFEVAISYKQLQILNLNCPNCKSKNISRKYSPFSFILKGKGWGKDNSEK
jgi:putative FmdB family regulatory protein